MRAPDISYPHRQPPESIREKTTIQSIISIHSSSFSLITQFSPRSPAPPPALTWPVRRGCSPRPQRESPSQLSESPASSTAFQAFGGNPLNKLHLYRKDVDFLQQLLTNERSRFIAFHSLKPILIRRPSLARPPNHSFGGSTLDARECIAAFSQQDLRSSGVHLKENATCAILLGQAESSEQPAATDAGFGSGSLLANCVYYAINVDDSQKALLINVALARCAAAAEPRDLRVALPLLNFAEGRDFGSSFAPCSNGIRQRNTAGIADNLHCRSGRWIKERCIVDSEQAEKFPRGCGRVLYARNDPVTITLAVSHDGTRVLLGRKREFPANVYTAIAGFMEPGETVDESVRRELHEETGVKVRAVRFWNSQPWPFLGGQVMLGCFAQVSRAEDEKIELLDRELEDARWFSHSDIGAMIDASNQAIDTWSISPLPAAVEGKLRIPSPFAIAYSLIAHWHQFRHVDAVDVERARTRAVLHQNDSVFGHFIAHL